jgi:hypothetical protein
MRVNPDFIGVGAAKAGTTTLHDILVQHPDIYLPSFKEAHFFDLDENFEKGEKWYDRTVFGDYKNQRIKGEITPSYIYFDDVPQRIFDMFGPNTKLIFMFRHPVGRAWSHYRMHHLRGNDPLSFEDALKAEPERLKGDYLSVSRYSYLDRGFYAKQLKRYLDFFPKDKMHFILFEDFVKDIPGHMKGVLEFLGLDQADLDYSVKSNRQAEMKSMRLAKLVENPNKIKALLKPIIPSGLVKKTRKKLKRLNEGKESKTKLDPKIRKETFKRYFEKDTTELAQLTNLDLSSWLT